jgi:hypothetical protein
MIPSVESEVSKLTFELSQPHIAANHLLLQEVTGKIQETEKKVQNLYQEWEELLEKLN